MTAGGGIRPGTRPRGAPGSAPAAAARGGRPSACRPVAVVVEHGVPGPALLLLLLLLLPVLLLLLLLLRRADVLRDVGDLAGVGVEAGQVLRAQRQGVEQFGGDLLGAGLDGVAAGFLDEFLEQADDAAGAAEQVLGHAAAAEHAVAAVQEPELLLDADKVGGPGGDAVRGAV